MEHVWSDPVCIYEQFEARKCSGCGAVIFCGDDPPSDEDFAGQNGGTMPKDCEATRPLVAQGRFVWNFEDPPSWLGGEHDRWTWSKQAKQV